MKKIICVLFIFVLYLLIMVLKIDNLNQKAIYLFFTGYRNNIYNNQISNKAMIQHIMIQHIFKILMIPFNNIEYIDKIHGGAIFTSYCFKYYPNYIKNLSSKLFWYNFFKKYNINHPKLYLYKLDNRIYKKYSFEKNKDYIFKPIFGTRGYNIKLINEKNIGKYIEKYDNFIIQEKMNDCIFNDSTAYRVVTLYNGDIFNVYRQSNKHNITSQAGYFVDCNISNCFPNNLIKNKFNEIVNKLKNLHKIRFNKVISLGWDIMINCKNEKVEVYCLEGNMFCTCYRSDNSNFTYYNNKYKKIVSEFYRISNI